MTDSTPDWSDRTLLVTGATGAMGRAVALWLAQRQATVILTGRKVKALETLADSIDAAGGQPIIYPVDLAGATGDDYHRMSDAIRTQCDSLDLVLHLAAAFHGLTPLEQLDAKHFTDALSVKVNAPFLMNQALVPLLSESRGRIVFALDWPDPTTHAYWGGYGVANAGVRALMNITAAELEARHVSVAGFIPPVIAGGLRRKAYMEEPDSVTPAEQIVPLLADLLDSRTPIPRGTVIDLNARSDAGREDQH